MIPMPEDVRRRIYEEAGFDFSGSICRAAKLNDLDMDSIESFRAKWVEKSGNKRLMSKSVEQLLYDCEAITDEGVTYAALILFGTRKSLGRFCPRQKLFLNIVLLRVLDRRVRERNFERVFLPAIIDCGN